VALKAIVPNETLMTEGGAAFTIDRQATEAFSQLSGDANPLHLDEVVARRSIYGRCVVHGVHLILCALEERASHQQRGRQSIVEVHLRFFRPAFHDTPITAEYATDGATTEIKISDENHATLASAVLIEQPATGNSEDLPHSILERGAPRLLSPSDAHGFADEAPLALDRRLATTLFPCLLDHARPFQLAELLASTRIVGMKCPGLYSTLTGIHLRSVPPGRSTDTASFRAAHIHAHTGRMRIAMEGPTLGGEIEAFFRPREVIQPPFSEVKAGVERADLVERHTLIVGGSRGLGELAAKICAARGARVLITYRLGEADARRVCSEIVEGGGCCEVTALDVVGPTESWHVPDGFVPTDVLYFATPPIGARGPTFDPRRFRDFCAVYVNGFVAVVDFATSLGIPGLTVFYPSTVFIDSGEGAPEYVAAKAAGEAVARWIGSRPGIRVLSVRLPSIATDETVTFLGMTRAPALPTLLAALGKVGDAS